MTLRSSIYIAGHRGLVGSAIVRKLKSSGYENLVTRTHSELDLTRQADVEAFFEKVKPEYVVLAAAKVGGIMANNTYPAEFIQQNLAIQLNVIHQAWRSGVKRLLFLGSSCIYPRDCPQPMKEEYLLTGPLEATNSPYAVAKIAGIEMCAAYNRQYGTRFLAVMPTNLYGPGDNFDLKNSHVLPALIRKMHEAKSTGQESVMIWGTGSPRREFLHSDDLADACVYLMGLPDETFDQALNPEVSAPATYSLPLVNIGYGEDITIKDLALLIKDIVGFEGSLTFDTSKPDGTMRKLLDVSRINNLGWKQKIDLRRGIEDAYRWYLENYRKLDSSRGGMVA
ncbi:MAG TPA: GDP-L-fucose synthase [Gammaproteobacteria bacterium]|nr:GDP-L-fucose synthase [Gammaproteobacteria bacterium]